MLKCRWRSYGKSFGDENICRRDERSECLLDHQKEFPPQLKRKQRTLKPFFLNNLRFFEVA